MISPMLKWELRKLQKEQTKLEQELTQLRQIDIEKAANTMVADHFKRKAILQDKLYRIADAYASKDPRHLEDHFLWKT